ncbi:MAG: hypothetical protein V2A76_09720 [Planctomycetota bacterium]
MRARTGFGALLAMAAALVVAGIAVVGGEDGSCPTSEEVKQHSYGLECFWVNANGDRQRQTCPEALRQELERGMNGISVTPARGDLGTIRLTFLETELQPFDDGWQRGFLPFGYRVDARISSATRASTWDGRHMLVARTEVPGQAPGKSFAEQRARQERRLARQLVSCLPGRFRRD